MDKILLIIQREYLSRVKKKSFVILTFLVPFLIIGMYALIYYLSKNGSDTVTQVYVLDESGIFQNNFKSTKYTTFHQAKDNLFASKKIVSNENSGFLLFIPKDIENGNQPEIFSKKKPGFSILGNIEDQMNETLRIKMLKDAGIDLQTLEKIKPNISIKSKEITEYGEKDSSAGAATIASFAAAILIYMSLFIYGAQVMRGVIEEKSTRIIEVVISSVKPFQLMMGKIIGIGLVGLTQFLLWIVLSGGLMATVGQSFIAEKTSILKTEKTSVKDKTVQTQFPQDQKSDIQKAIES